MVARYMLILVLITDVLSVSMKQYHLWSDEGHCLFITKNNSMNFIHQRECTILTLRNESILQYEPSTFKQAAQCLVLRQKSNQKSSNYYNVDLESCVMDEQDKDFLRSEDLKNFQVVNDTKILEERFEVRKVNSKMKRKSNLVLSPAELFYIFSQEHICIRDQYSTFKLKDTKNKTQERCTGFIEGHHNILAYTNRDNAMNEAVCMFWASILSDDSEEFNVLRSVKCMDISEGVVDGVRATKQIFYGQHPKFCMTIKNRYIHLKFKKEIGEENCARFQFGHEYITPTTTTTVSTTTNLPTSTTTTTTTTTSKTTSTSTTIVIPTTTKIEYNASIIEMEEDLGELEKLEYSPLFKNKTELLVTSASLVLNKLLNDENENVNKSNEAGFQITKLLRKIGDIVSEKLGNKTESFYFKSPENIEFEVSHFTVEDFEGHKFPHTNESERKPSINLPKSVASGKNKDGEILKIKSIIYPAVPAMNSTKKQRLLTEFVISTRVSPKIHDLQGDNIRLQFPIQSLGSNINERIQCAYWDYEVNKWRSDGCYYVQKMSTDELVTCECTHLTDFSVLMTVVDHEKMNLTESDYRNLHFISTTGCIISIVFLLLAVGILLTRRNLRKNQRYQIHTNLCIALIIANTILLLSDKDGKTEAHCIAISMMLFYFFIAAFVWMLCEAIFVWRALITVFTENDRIVYYMLFGWGTPLAIVLTTGLISPSNLTTESTCWLSWKDSTIFAFAAPVLAIILINTVILVVVLVATNKHAKDTKRGQIRSLARMVLILLPVFGLTWVFGILAINKETIIFRYIFAIFNSLQGFLIFVCYIQASREVRKELRKATWEQYSSLFKRSTRSQTVSYSY